MQAPPAALSFATIHCWARATQASHLALALRIFSHDLLQRTLSSPPSIGHAIFVASQVPYLLTVFHQARPLTQPSVHGLSGQHSQATYDFRKKSGTSSHQSGFQSAGKVPPILSDLQENSPQAASPTQLTTTVSFIAPSK